LTLKVSTSFSEIFSVNGCDHEAGGHEKGQIIQVRLSSRNQAVFSTTYGNNMKKSLLSLAGVALLSVSTFALAEKTYTCTAVVNGNETSNSVSISVMNSQSGSDAEIKAANVFSSKGIKFDRINCVK
jgi:hypothetical protein